MKGSVHQRLCQAGNFVREEILSAFIRLVAHTPELQAYTASKLYTALQDDISQESLTLAALWVIGEYGDVLFEGGVVDDDQPKQVSDYLCLESKFDYLIPLDNRQGPLRSTAYHPRLALRQLSYTSIPHGKYYQVSLQIDDKLATTTANCRGSRQVYH